MSPIAADVPLTSFETFGVFLKYLRRRAHVTQRRLAFAVGYSEAHVCRMERDQRSPDLTALTALFVPALHLGDQPELVGRLLSLAAAARHERPPHQVALSERRMTPAAGQRAGRADRVPTPLRRPAGTAGAGLPVFLNSFVGRGAELKGIARFLVGREAGVRLLTVTGPPGIGNRPIAPIMTAG